MSRRIAVAVLLPWLMSSTFAPRLAAQQPRPRPPAELPSQESAKDVVNAADRKAAAAAADEAVRKIKEEGLDRSQVMKTLGYLTDVIGPRLTGSPNLRRANAWTRSKMTEWGLTDSHLEPWGPFGRGWSLRRFNAQVVEPQCIPLIAYPKAWSPGTDGPLVGEVAYFDAASEKDFGKFRGKLKGAIVLASPIRELKTSFEPYASRISDTDLLRLADAGEGDPRPSRGPRPATAGPQSPTAGSQPPVDRRAQRELARKRARFLAEEGAVLLVDSSPIGQGGTLFVAEASMTAGPVTRKGESVRPWDRDATMTIPQIVLAAEHYNRLARMIRQGEKVTLAVDLAVEFHDDDPMAANTVAEIPGTDLKDEVVMLGGHLDSWHAGTGATDNAAGVAVAMEAARILKAVGLRPRRTIRVGLWTGEEQGLLGSRAYVREHFGSRDDSPAARYLESAFGIRPRIQLKDGHEKLSAYFNLDNGTGKVRGVYLEGNEAVRPIFRRWLAPFRELGATTLTIAPTFGTDHQSFDAVGLPAFQFIQDPIDYNSRTHHSNMDVLDRIQADDMKQAAVIVASFAYNAAMADRKLPRKPLPVR